MVESKSIRGLDKKTISAKTKLIREQLSRTGVTADFDLDYERDLIYSITGKSKSAFNSLGLSITGKETLNISTKVDVRNIKDIVIECIKIYNRTDYKTDFSWIDHVTEVKDEFILDLLNNKLVGSLDAGDGTIWLAVPEIVDWTDFGGFKYSTRKGDNSFEELELETLLAEFGKVPDLEELTKHHICFWSKNEDKKIASWSYFACLNADLELNSKNYILSNRKWFIVDSKYIAKLNKDIAKIKPTKITLPQYDHARESDYNKAVCSSLDAYFLDADEVMHGEGKDQIEVCDVFTQDKQFLHVKKYENASSISHLFNQGFVSAHLLARDSDFREKVKAKITVSKFKKLIPTAKLNTVEFSVIYVIIRKKPAKGSYRLSLFSKISLRKCVKELEGYGYQVYLNWIENIKP